MSKSFSIFAGGAIAATGNAEFAVMPEALQAQSSGNQQEILDAPLQNSQAQLRVRITHNLLANLPTPQLDQMESACYLRTDGSDEVMGVNVKDGTITLNEHPVAFHP